MGRSYRRLSGLLVVGLLLQGCYGPFHLTRKV